MAAEFPNTPNVTSIPAAQNVKTGNTGTAKGFIPQIWSDEILASYELSLVAANHVKKLSMKGKKGDTMHIPRPDRGIAHKKVVQNSVTLNAGATDTLPLVVNEHYEYSRHIEDLAEVQALSSLRRFYTEDAGYALAKRVDTDLLNLGTGFGSNDGVAADPSLPASWVQDQCFVPTATGIAAFAVGSTPTAITDAGTIVEAIRVLDEQDVPMSNRVMIVPPTAIADMRKIPEFINADYVSGQPVVSGKIGSLYGVDVYVSTNVPVIDTTGGGNEYGLFLMHRDALVLVEQQGIRSQTQYQQEYLSTLYTADRIYGCSVYRPESGVIIAVGR